MTDPDVLTVPEALLLLEALDSFIPYEEGSPGWRGMTTSELEDWNPYRLLRRKLQEPLGMRMSDRAVSWLEDLLRNERRMAMQELQRTLFEALAEPSAKRSEIRQRFVETFNRCLGERQFRPHLIAPWDRPR